MQGFPVVAMLNKAMVLGPSNESSRISSALTKVMRNCWKISDKKITLPGLLMWKEVGWREGAI